MTITVRYFAVLRDQAGLAVEQMEVEPMTGRELVDELIVSKGFGLPSPLIRIAVNGSFVADTTKLSSGDEVVLIPPTAGG